MSRYDTAALVAALLCVAAIGFAAATVAAPVETEDVSTRTDAQLEHDVSPFDFDIDSETDWGDGPGGGERTVLSATCIPFFLTPMFYTLVLLVVGGVFFTVRRVLASEYGFAAVAFVVPITIFFHAAYTQDCGSDPVNVDFGFPEGTVINKTASEATQTVSPETGTPVLGLLVAGAFLLLVVAALVTTVRQQASSLESAPAEQEASPTHDLGGVARVAGEAADRIEGGEAAPGNAVYRAWQDMTSHLAVPDTQTTTPAEFRAAALDAGMSDAHVSTITDIFREVRYGGEAPTTDREERAIEALRAIEDAYGGEP